jgi:glyoxylase-like metal-dependent hydrolase (beta-lactamase superfamily II)
MSTPTITRRSALAGIGALAAAPLLRPTIAGATAPMLGPSRPTHYRFRLGDYGVTTLLDGALQFDGPHPIFGEDQPEDAVQELAEANFLPRSRMENVFVPVVVGTGERLVLFDAGNAAARGPGAGNLVAVLEAAGYRAEQVDVVVITHMHPDHIGGLMADGRPAFPNARYVTGQVEYDFWAHEDRLSGPTEGVARLVQSNVVPLAERMSFIGDGDEVVPGITAQAAFGHTPGHLAFHLESGGRRLLLWADTANHYVVSVQRPDWHVRFDMDKEGAAATRRRLLDMAASERLPVIGYHMPFPGVGYIDRGADGYRWVPASYQLNL